jgi:hypothetical protein
MLHRRCFFRFKGRACNSGAVALASGTPLSAVGDHPPAENVGSKPYQIPGYQIGLFWEPPNLYPVGGHPSSDPYPGPVEAASGSHDDIVCALQLAVWGAERRSQGAAFSEAWRLRTAARR